MKKILLLGATGYLGYHLAVAMTKQGHDILCIKRVSSSMKRLLSILPNAKFVTVEEPLFEQKILTYAPDIVINTSGMYDRDDAPFFSILNANYTFPLRVLSLLAQEADCCPLWINSNTSLSYYLNIYSFSKHQFSEWGRFFSEKGQIRFCNILLEHFYGPNDSRNKFVAMLLHQMKKDNPIDLTEGLQRRDFIYIDDVVLAYLFLCENPPEKSYLDLPLGSGESVQLREFILYLKKLLSSNSELHFGAVPKRRQEPDNLVANMDYWVHHGFKIQYNWQNGLQKLVEDK